MAKNQQQSNISGQGLESFFATPERYTDKKIKEQVDISSHNPVIDGVMRTVGGVLAVLNKYRQVIAINEEFFKVMGIDRDDHLLGLRLGEAVKCIHAKDMPAGCGTGKYCNSCGAAIAMVSCLNKSEAAERLCIIQVKRDRKITDLCLKVRACPIDIEGEEYILLLIYDHSNVQRWASMEKIFFHDLQNMLCGIVGKAELMKLNDADHKDNSEYLQQMLKITRRLSHELDVHKKLFEQESFDYKPVWEEVTLNEIMGEVKEIVSEHKAAIHKKLDYTLPEQAVEFTTDSSLLLRILCNMTINALENSDNDETVKVWSKVNDGALEFHVWNSSFIPEPLALRIFQKNFSTKSHAGHGFGTYCMKFFGEKVLSGNISFTSEPDDGTEFVYKLYI